MMKPQEFIEIVDEWTSTGGPIPKFAAHDVTTVAEAEAVCRAVASPHVDDAGKYGQLALFDLMSFFQSSESEEASFHFRDHGLPILRRILTDALDQESRCDVDDENLAARRRAHLFVVKILCAYQQAGDASLIIKAARDPSLSDGYLWSTIFGMIAERHPKAVDICDRLRSPLPDGAITTPYLDFANALARKRAISRHPFDSETGIARLSAFLCDRNPENYGSAISATASIPFLEDKMRETQLDSATAHPDACVRIEAAWASATLGRDIGRRRLVEFCLDPRVSERASLYLEELGLTGSIPAEAHRPGFRAMAQMCSWLAHPREFGRPPDEIEPCDTRELNWPPTGDRHRFWLFAYRYEPQADDDPGEGIGLVGPTTFALSDVAPDLEPEDVYGLHCCWELRWAGDPRAPKECTAAAGRKMIAEINHDFERA